MSQASMGQLRNSSDAVAAELVELKARILALPASIRTELQPLIEDALEHAVFRDRILSVAREALGQFRLDLAMTRFDLEMTRREHDNLVRRGEPGQSGD